MSDQNDPDGVPLADGNGDLRAQTDALRATLREARKHGLSPEERATIKQLIVAIRKLLDENDC